MQNDRVLIIDGMEYHKWDREVFEILRVGDITAINATCAIWEDARETLENIGHWHRRFEEHSDLIVQAVTVDDIRKAYEEEKTAIVLGFQNTSPIEDNIDFVGIFAALGIRIMQLTYNTQNLVGSGCYEDEDSGLSTFGRDVVKEMNRHGVLIDLSHVGERTSMDTIEISSQPVSITHANPKFVKQTQRNKSDDMLRALGDSGGVLGLAVYPHLFSSDATVEQFCEMVARTVDLMGVQHVGIGSDHHLGFSAEERKWWVQGRWSRSMPAFMSAQGFHPPDWQGEEVEWQSWFKTPAGMPNIVRGLREHGFSPDEVAAIMGGNFLRLFDQVFAEAVSPVTSRTVAQPGG
ncbi:MAG: membrane dipeptidase [Dehalococcoidia bacterium]